MNPGDYSERFQRQVYGRTFDSAGGVVPSFTPDAYYWGLVENVTSQDLVDMEATVTEIRATIRLRQYPAISSRDRLVDTSGQTWEVMSLYYGDNETVINGRIRTDGSE